MTISDQLTPELQARIEAISARSRWTPKQIIEDALENGHSLDWQERFLDHVQEGIAEADRGEFVSQAEVESTFNRFRPV